MGWWYSYEIIKGEGTGNINFIRCNVNRLYIYIWSNLERKQYNNLQDSSNPVEGRTKIYQLKDLILTLFGLIFRRI